MYGFFLNIFSYRCINISSVRAIAGQSERSFCTRRVDALFSARFAPANNHDRLSVQPRKNSVRLVAGRIGVFKVAQAIIGLVPILVIHFQRAVAHKGSKHQAVYCLGMTRPANIKMHDAITRVRGLLG